MKNWNFIKNVREHLSYFVWHLAILLIAVVSYYLFHKPPQWYTYDPTGMGLTAWTVIFFLAAAIFGVVLCAIDIYLFDKFPALNRMDDTKSFIFTGIFFAGLYGFVTIGAAWLLGCGVESYLNGGRNYGHVDPRTIWFVSLGAGTLAAFIWRFRRRIGEF